MTAIDRKQAMDVLKAFGKAFNKGDNIFPALTEISNEILNKAGVSVFQKEQPES